MKKLIFAIMIATLMRIASVPLASAGGWTVTTLDQVPTNVVAGQAIKVGFMIRQHGQTPWTFENVQVRAVHVASNETTTVKAQHDGAPGHYTADITFPKSGIYHWAVASGLYPEWQPLPDLTVLDPAAAEAAFAAAEAVKNPKPTSASLPFSLPLALGVIGLVGSSAGLIFWMRTRGRMITA
jgi:hypothetical protein